MRGTDTRIEDVKTRLFLNTGKEERRRIFKGKLFQSDGSWAIKSFLTTSLEAKGTKKKKKRTELCRAYLGTYGTKNCVKQQGKSK